MTANPAGGSPLLAFDCVTASTLTFLPTTTDQPQGRVPWVPGGVAPDFPETWFRFVGG